MIAIAARLRSVLDATRDRTGYAARPDGEEDDRGEQSTSELFQCPSCDVVYIDTDKETCSDCDEAVERVPSSLSET